MIFNSLPMHGAFLIEPNKMEDERGFFARIFCREAFAREGLEANIVQANSSYSKEKGTLRGLHYQLPPAQETKLVKCLSGVIYDLILDLRTDSPTFGRSFGEVLTPKNGKMMYVPKGFAHGFLTLEPDSEIFYLVSAAYSKHDERGIRWNDPLFNIQWPENPAVISGKDQSHPDFDPGYHLKAD